MYQHLSMYANHILYSLLVKLLISVRRYRIFVFLNMMLLKPAFCPLAKLLIPLNHNTVVLEFRILKFENVIFRIWRKDCQFWFCLRETTERNRRQQAAKSEDSKHKKNPKLLMNHKFLLPLDNDELYNLSICVDSLYFFLYSCTSIKLP